MYTHEHTHGGLGEVSKSNWKEPSREKSDSCSLAWGGRKTERGRGRKKREVRNSEGREMGWDEETERDKEVEREKKEKEKTKRKTTESDKDRCRDFFLTILDFYQWDVGSILQRCCISNSCLKSRFTENKIKTKTSHFGLICPGVDVCAWDFCH